MRRSATAGEPSRSSPIAGILTLLVSIVAAGHAGAIGELEGAGGIGDRVGSPAPPSPPALLSVPSPPADPNALADRGAAEFNGAPGEAAGLFGTRARDGEAMLAGMGREGVASTRDVRAEGVKLEAPVTRLAWQAVVTLSSGAGLRCGPGEAFGRLPVQVGAGTWVCISERSGGSDLVETGSKASVRPTDPVESRAAVLPLLSDDYLDAGARPSLRDSVAVSEADLAPTPASETLSNSVGAPAPDWLPLVLLAGFAALAPALYRRLTSEGVRAQAVRAGLLAAVRARPGRTLSDLARETGLHVSTVGYHSRMLSDAGAVVLHRDGRAVRVFENGGRYGPADRARWSVGNRAGVARLVAILPPAGARAGDVARVLGITPRAIRKRLPTLEQAGLVRVERLPSGLSILPGAWATRAP